jgi:hypothetical protein
MYQYIYLYHLLDLFWFFENIKYHEFAYYDQFYNLNDVFVQILY